MYGTSKWRHAANIYIKKLEETQCNAQRKIGNKPWFIRNEQLRKASKRSGIKLQPTRKNQEGFSEE